MNRVFMNQGGVLETLVLSGPGGVILSDYLSAKTFFPPN